MTTDVTIISRWLDNLAMMRNCNISWLMSQPTLDESVELWLTIMDYLR